MDEIKQQNEEINNFFAEYANEGMDEIEDELISIRFKINAPCEMHVEKYKMLYCFTCNKSICMDCFTHEHGNHKVEEKADYLAPAKLLMNSIFSNSALFKADSRLSKYMDCVAFRSNLKLNIFDNLSFYYQQVFYNSLLNLLH